MFTIEGAVQIVLYLLGAGLIFGLLFFLIDYVAKNTPFFAPFAGVAKVVLVVMGVLILIGIILGFMGHPILDIGPSHRH